MLTICADFYAPLATFIRVNAKRSCDLKGGGGDREAWLPVVFDTDIAASRFPFMQTKPGISFTWFYLLVLSPEWTFVPVACLVLSIVFYPFYVYWSLFPFHIEIEHLCSDCFVAFILIGDIETSLCSLWSVSTGSFVVRWVYERAGEGARRVETKPDRVDLRQRRAESMEQLRARKAGWRV